MIFDVSQNFANFLTYKGNKIDVAEYVIAQAINKTNKDEFLEKTRKSFYYSMKMGSLLGIFLDKMNTKLPELYKDCAWFEQDKLMKPSELMKEEFYKKKILKEEEDVDSFGNKGHFEADKNFKFFILLNGDRLEEYTQQCDLKLELFEYLKIL